MKDLAVKYPSLKLAYEHVKDVLSEQNETARSYVDRAITLLSVATATIGIGVPLLYNKGVLQKWFLPGIRQVTASGIPVVIFFVIALYAYRAIKTPPFKTKDEPKAIRDEFAKLQPEEFYQEMINRIEKASKENESVLKIRHDALSILLWLTIVETIVMVFLLVGVSPFLS